MEANFTPDYRTQTVQVNNKKIPLDQLRGYLLSHYPDLCANNFIKAIRTPAGIIFTYDWENIFYVVKTSCIWLHFIQYLNPVKKR